MWLLLFSFLAQASDSWHEPSQLSCEFNIAGSPPIASLQINFAQNFAPIPPAKINFSGTLRDLSITREEARPNEWARLYFSKEDPANALIMVLFEERAPNLRRALLINPNFTIGDRMSGSCQRVPRVTPLRELLF